tara:strand:- start:574 stop:1248 length:675 start_codon:yes stop_codon:yes gene_type:complete
MNRLIIRDRKFMELSGVEENVLDVDNYSAVIVNAAPISRSYYSGDYDPDKLSTPVCWSADTQTPSTDVPADTKQAARCMDCKHNIRGSGYGSSRACRFSQRLAIMPEGRWGDVFQLRLPATSIFGQARDGHMPMQAYARFLKEHDTPVIAVFTRIYFDRHSETPKLFFKPTRSLGDEELSAASSVIDSSETIQAITLQYTPFEGVNKSPFETTDGFIQSDRRTL